MAASKSVALVVETSGAYTRGLLHGLMRFVREHGGWQLALADHHPRSGPPAWMAEWRGDGVIARIDTPLLARAIRNAGCAAVDMSDARLVAEFPSVKTDDEAVGRMAVTHLVERRVESLAYCGDERFNWSTQRGVAFAAAAAKLGIPCASYSYADWGRKAELDLAAWLAALPKPVGLLAANDARGREVLAAAKLNALLVPEQIAVLGVDNDDLLCDLSDPPLSSIVPDTDRIGYLAAELLNSLMHGDSIPQTVHRILPVGVITRQSSDRLTVNDKEVAAAMRYIRARACDGANVEDVLKAVQISRRSLEVRFHRELGRTPHDEIMRVRLERAKALLEGTELPLEAVAHRCGFRHAEYMSRVFRRELATTPGHWRQSQYERKQQAEQEQTPG
jgi:LacI family transcriptional regulator